MRTFILGAGISIAMTAALALDASSGCKPGQVSNDIDLINAECAFLESHPGTPDVAIIACEVFDLTGKIIQQFNVQLPADQAPAFIAAHPVKAGHPMPAGASSK